MLEDFDDRTVSFVESIVGIIRAVPQFSCVEEFKITKKEEHVAQFSVLTLFETLNIEL